MVRDKKAMMKNIVIVIGILVVLVLGYVEVVKGEWSTNPFFNSGAKSDEQNIQDKINEWSEDRYSSKPIELIGFDNGKVKVDYDKSLVSFEGTNIYMDLTNPPPNVASIEFVNGGDGKDSLVYTSRGGKEVTIYDGTINSHGFYENTDEKNKIRVFPKLRNYDDAEDIFPNSYFEEEEEKGSWIKIEEGGKRISFKDARFKLEIDKGEADSEYAEFSSVDEGVESFVEVVQNKYALKNADMVVRDKEFKTGNSDEKCELRFSLVEGKKIDLERDVYGIKGEIICDYQNSEGKKISSLLKGFKNSEGEYQVALVALNEELKPSDLPEVDGPVVAIDTSKEEPQVVVSLPEKGQGKVEVVSEKTPELVDVSLTAGKKEKEGKSEVEIKVREEGKEETYAKVGDGDDDKDRLKVAMPGPGEAVVGSSKKGVIDEVLDKASENLKRSENLLAQARGQDFPKEEMVAVTGPSSVDPVLPPDLEREAKEIIKQMQEFAKKSSVTYQAVDDPFVEETPEQTAEVEAQGTLVAARVKSLTEPEENKVETPVVETPTPMKAEPEYVEKKVVVYETRKVQRYMTWGWRRFVVPGQYDYKRVPITKTIKVLKDTSSTTQVKKTIPQVVTQKKAVVRTQARTPTYPRTRPRFFICRRWR